MAELKKLISQLASPLPAAQHQARAQLVAAGEPAVDALLSALCSDVREIRGTAALILGQMRAARAIDAIGEVARGDEDASVRPLAVRALADIADARAPTRLKVLLIDALGSKDMFCRALACTGLGRVGDEHSREALRLAQRDDEEWVRDAARKALAAGPRRPPGDRADAGADEQAGSAQLGTALARREEPTTSTALATADQAIAGLVGDLLALDPARQARAREALEGYGAAAVPRVAPLLYDQMPGTRRAAAETLGALGVPEAVTPLADLLADEDSPSGVQAVALYAIGQLLDRTEVPDFPRALVASCLGDPDPYVRAAAAATLMRVGGGARLEALEAVIDDDEEWVHVSGLAALAAVAGPEDQRLRDVLLDGLVRIADLDALCLLLEALGRVLAEPLPDDRVAFAPLTHFLTHEEPRVRQRAARALAALAPSLEHGAIEAQGLEPLLRVADTDPEVAREVVAIVAAGAERESTLATRGLARLLSAAEREVAQAAARALGSVGGRMAIDALVDIANADPQGRAGWTVVVAAQVLASLDDSATVTATRDERGRWERRVRLRCHSCEEAPALEWRRVRGESSTVADVGREELRCPSCDAEHVVGANEKALLVGRAPFGVCRCCPRKRLLVRRGDTQALICPVTERQHIRPYDHPRQVRLLDELPQGACQCCAEPQPLIRLDDRVVCYRTRRHHMPTEHGYSLPQERVSDDVAAINDALLLGTLGIGQSGLPSVAGEVGDTDDAED